MQPISVNMSMRPACMSKAIVLGLLTMPQSPLGMALMTHAACARWPPRPWRPVRPLWPCPCCMQLGLRDFLRVKHPCKTYRPREPYTPDPCHACARWRPRPRRQ